MFHFTRSVFLGAFIFIVSCGGAGSSNADLATCLRSEILAGSNCGCDLQLPVDINEVYASNGIWPFGVHGGGHPEGHPGWDFIGGPVSGGGSQLVISAPGAGHIYRITADSAGEDAEGHDVYIKLDCGIRIVFTPMRPDSNMVVGTQITKGQRLGLMSAIQGTSWSVHFGTVAKDDDPKKTNVCPTPFFSSAIVSQLDTLVANASFSEKSARTSSFTCVDSSTLSISLPAEPNLCASHLSESLASQIEACIQPANIWVW